MRLKLTDKNQQTVWQAEQKGFEFVVHQQDVKQPLRFPGQVEDRETGFYYNYHRYYNPEIGRYTQPDPIGLAGGFNPYVYASNNPIMKVDPSGLYCFDFNEFSTYVRDNRSNNSANIAALISTLTFGTMPKTPSELRGLGVKKTQLNPTTSQLSRWNGRLSRLTNKRTGRFLREIGRSKTGIKLGALATGFLIFDGFYNWGVIVKATYEATSLDGSSDCECGD